MFLGSIHRAPPSIKADLLGIQPASSYMTCEQLYDLRAAIYDLLAAIRPVSSYIRPVSSYIPVSTYRTCEQLYTTCELLYDLRAAIYDL